MQRDLSWIFRRRIRGRMRIEDNSDSESVSKILHNVLSATAFLLISLCAVRIDGFMTSFNKIHKSETTRRTSYSQNKQTSFYVSLQLDNSDDQQSISSLNSTLFDFTNKTTLNSTTNETLQASNPQSNQDEILQEVEDESPSAPSSPIFPILQSDPFQATGQEELFKTLAGGQAMIFEMARKSMLSKGASTNDADTSTSSTIPIVPKRWYPYSGVVSESENNPSFRTQAPVMNNQGFAKSIWKNARKRNKPSLWRHALRTYDRMTILEKNPTTKFSHINRSNRHHEGAMLACAKLGLWQRALEIYHFVYQKEMDSQEAISSTLTTRQLESPEQAPTTIKSTSTSTSFSANTITKESLYGTSGSSKRKRVFVTDDMVHSLVRACVRASRLRSRRKYRQRDDNYDTAYDGNVEDSLSHEEEEREAALRRIPLDTALEILHTLPEERNIALVAHLVNPLAAAYQSLGYIQEAKDIVQTMLSNRTAEVEEIFNVNDLTAKDKGSYSILVQGAVLSGDWGSAVEALGDMTKAGLYPEPRHCNSWSEISERQTRPRAVGSWKKKRDDYWTDSFR